MLSWNKYYQSMILINWLHGIYLFKACQFANWESSPIASPGCSLKNNNNIDGSFIGNLLHKSSRLALLQGKRQEWYSSYSSGFYTLQNLITTYSYATYQSAQSNNLYTLYTREVWQFANWGSCPLAGPGCSLINKMNRTELE